MKINKTLKRIISAFSAVCISASLMTATVSADDSPASGWTMNAIGNTDAKAVVDATESYAGGQSIKLVSSTPGKPNVYTVFSVDVKVKKGRTYRFAFASKAKDNYTTTNYCINWEERHVFKDMYGASFDWVKKSFLWTNKGGDGTATLKFIIDGAIDGGIWLDDFECREWDGEVVGDNLISNPSFEKDKAKIKGGKETTKVVDIDSAADAEELAAAIRQTDEFDGEKYNEAISMFSNMPLVKKENITIDGDSSDWDGVYKVHVPSAASQYYVYSSSSHLDIEMDYMAAYDDDNFYLYIETTDDVFVPDYGQYWQSDSIQLAMGDRSESFGDEVGLKYTDDGGYYISNSWRFDEVAKIKLKTLHEGDKTIYEVSIPWSVQFGARPESEFLFSILANDNDGEGRGYVAELRPGIAEGKTNAKFISYNLMEPGEDFYCSLEEVGTGYGILVTNNSDQAKEFTVKSEILGIDETVTIEAGKGKNIRGEAKDLKIGKNEVSAVVSNSDFTRKLTKIVDIEPDEEIMQSIYADYEAKATELERLVKICTMLGYDTDYEQVRIWMIRQAIEDLEDDFESEYYYPIANGDQAVQNMYKEAKENMLGYISKKKEAVQVPKFQTGDIEIDGETMIADMKIGNRIERRPTYFIGYGHFFQAQRDIPKLEKVTSTALQAEIGTSGVVYSKDVIGNLDGWTNYGLASLGDGLTIDQKETEGSNGKAFYIHNETPSGPNKYAFWYQSTEGLGRGETYVVKFRAKANNATGVSLVFNGVSDIRYSLDGTYDWKDFEYEVVMKPKQNKTMWGLVCENLVDEFWIDDLTFCKKGEDRNFCKNGNFESEYQLVGDYAVSQAAVARLGEMLDELAQYNQTMDLLLSPHYFPYNLLEEGGQLASGGFLKVDISNEQAREIIKLQIEALLSPYKDHPALKTIVLTNEPTFNAAGNGDVYIEPYRNWLKERYNGDISKLNYNYNTSYASFDEVEWQSTDGTPGYYDLVCFNNEFFNEFHAFMAECVKEVCPNVAVTAKPMDYNAYSDAGGKRGYLNYGTDFTLFKDWMDVNGCDSWAYFNSETYNTMQGKMQWYDFMRSVQKAPGQNSEDHTIGDGNLDFVPEQAKWVEADLWQGALHGRTISDFWLWDTDYDNTPAGGSIRFRPDCIVAASDVAMDLNRLAYEATALQTKKADVGILYNISSRNYNLAWMNAVYRSWESVVYNGKKAEYITEDQLDKMFDYSILILPENYYVSEATAQKVLEYAEKGGRVIMVGEDCLKYNEYAKESSYGEKLKAYARVVPATNANEVMTSPSQTELKDIVAEELDKLGMRKVRLLNAETGEELNKVEYMYTEYNGKFIMNVCLYEWSNDIKMNIEVDGKRVESAKELRRCNALGSEITLSEYKPLMLEITL